MAIQRYFLCRFDPLGLGADPERLAWFAESERVHARWAMLAVAGIAVQVRHTPSPVVSNSIARGL